VVFSLAKGRNLEQSGYLAYFWDSVIQTLFYRRFKWPFLLLFGFNLIGCDPAYSGKSSVKNNSSYPLELKYKINIAIWEDSIVEKTILLPPDTMFAFTDFNGRGWAQYFKCCPCEFDSISIKPIDTTKLLTKDIVNEGNWQVFNPNKRGKYREEIECTFEITNADIH
jgi:hypothetical protein